MKLKFNSQSAFDTALTSLSGNNFKFDNYRDELALKFFTSECVVNAKLEIISHGLVDGSDFEYDRYAA